MSASGIRILPVLRCLMLGLLFASHLALAESDRVQVVDGPQHTVTVSTDVGAEPAEPTADVEAATPRSPRQPLPSQTSGSSAKLLSLMLGLTLIVILILALGWLARRMGQGGLLGNRHIKMLAAMPLGTRERLVVVEVGGQQLLLGITATQITTLHTFEAPVIVPDDSQGQSEFGKKLLALMQQKSPAATESRH